MPESKWYFEKGKKTITRYKNKRLHRFHGNAALYPTVFSCAVQDHMKQLKANTFKRFYRHFVPEAAIHFFFCSWQFILRTLWRNNDDGHETRSNAKCHIISWYDEYVHWWHTWHSSKFLKLCKTNNLRLFNIIPKKKKKKKKHMYIDYTTVSNIF